MKRPLKMLVDTGAQINILPLDTYLRIPDAHRPKIEKINHRIKLGDNGFMDAKGIATVKLTIEINNMKAASTLHHWKVRWCSGQDS